MCEEIFIRNSGVHVVTCKNVKILNTRTETKTFLRFTTMDPDSGNGPPQIDYFHTSLEFWVLLSRKLKLV